MLPRTLVIGATGTVGREVVSQLAERGEPVRAMTRNRTSPNFPAIVETVQGDLTNPDTLDPCLDAVDRVFLVWTAPGAAFPPAWDRIARKARRVVFLSAPIKTPHPFFQQPNAPRDLAVRIEDAIEASGLEWSFLRPGMFAANALRFWAPQTRAGDTVRWPYLDAPTAPVDERDIAEIGVHALLEDGHAGRDYVITGPESLTQREQIETIGRAIGRLLRIEELTRVEAQQRIFRVWPPPVAEMLLNAWAAALGQPAYVTRTVDEITGRPARTFLEWATRNAALF